MNYLKYISFLSMVLAITFSCSGIDDQPINPDSIIQLTILDATQTDTINKAVANGDSILVLVAKIPKDADSRIQSVVFKSSSGGSFLGLDSNNDTKRFDSERIAKTSFNLPLSEYDQKFFFRAEVSFDSQTYFSEKSIDLIGVKDIVTLEVLSENDESLESPILADGVTKLRLRAKVNFNKDEFDVVVFGKSKGTFVSIEGDNAIQKIDSQGFAEIFLTVTNEVGKLILSAQAGSSSTYIFYTDIDLTRAFPEVLTLEPSSTTISSDSNIDLTVFATRNNGKVSLNTPIKFDAIQIDDNENKIPIGRFTGTSQAKTDMDGKVSGVKFFIDTNDFDTTKPVLLIASSLNNQNELVESVVQINVNE
nr:hypothetical protein [uncultured Allomuricauda sp.]